MIEIVPPYGAGSDDLAKIVDSVRDAIAAGVNGVALGIVCLMILGVNFAASR